MKATTDRAKRRSLLQVVKYIGACLVVAVVVTVPVALGAAALSRIVPEDGPEPITISANVPSDEVVTVELYEYNAGVPTTEVLSTIFTEPSLAREIAASTHDVSGPAGKNNLEWRRNARLNIVRLVDSSGQHSDLVQFASGPTDYNFWWAANSTCPRETCWHTTRFSVDFGSFHMHQSTSDYIPTPEWVSDLVDEALTP